MDRQNLMRQLAPPGGQNMPESCVDRLRRMTARELGIRPPVNAEDLCGMVAECRRRPIRLQPQAFPASGPASVLLSTSDADWIFYQREMSRSQQAHLIMHQAGHLMAGHRIGEADDETLRALYPHLEPGVVRRVLRHGSYDDVQEQEAETIATILGTRAGCLWEPGTIRFRVH